MAALVNINDVKVYGYDKEPLISDLVSTVQCVVADNLGAHSIAEFFWQMFADFVRQIGSILRPEAFSLRTEEIHTSHLKTLEENNLDNCWC